MRRAALALCILIAACNPFVADHSDDVGAVLLDRFPPIKVHNGVNPDEVRVWANSARDVMWDVHEGLEAVYGPSKGFYVESISVVDEYHKPIEASCPGYRIVMHWDANRNTYYYFAAELHNLFRCLNYGPLNVYCSDNPIPSEEQCHQAHDLIESIP